MKFKAVASSMFAELQMNSRAVVSSPVVPILQNFLFEVENNKLVVTSSDLQISITNEVDIVFEEAGKIAVPAKILLETLKSLGGQEITFTANDVTNAIEITTTNGNYKLVGENAGDYVQVVHPKSEVNLPLSSSLLKEVLDTTSFAISNDELRPSMTGLLIDFEGDKTKFVSTNGHILAKYEIDEKLDIGTSGSVIIPKRPLSVLKEILSIYDEVAVQVSENMDRIYFKAEKMMINIRLIDEKFPDYEGAIPKENPKNLTIDKYSFGNSLKRAAIYADKTTHQVILDVNEHKLEIISEDLNFSNGSVEKAGHVSYEGDPIQIGFNAKYFTEVLQAIKSNEVSIEMSGSNKAAILKPAQKGDADILILMMPVMIRV